MQVLVERKQSKAKLILETVADNKFYIILVACLLLGMLFGALSVKTFDVGTADFVDGWFKSFLSFRLNSGFWQIFFKCFLSSFIYLVVICIAAFGVGGLPIFPLLMFFRGFGTCMLAGLLYKNCSLQGIAFADLILLPSCLVFDFVYVYLSSKAMALSSNCLSILRGSVQHVPLLKTGGIDLLKKCILCLTVAFLSSLAEAAFSACFSKYFNLV